MRGKLQRAAGATAAALVLGTAPAQAAERGDFVFELGTRTPGAGATMKFDVVYRDPDDPNAKPPPITAGTFRLPEGTRIDQDAVAKCRASDEELRAQGTSACPADSRVGGGTLTAVTGFGPPADPVTGQVTVFNGDGELIELVTVPDTGRTAGFDRLTVKGSTLTAHPPATPGGPPDGRTSIKEIHITVDRPGYAFAPPLCPGRDGWAYGASFEFGDGGKAEVARTLDCVAGRPALALSTQPRRARVGRRTTFRFALRSSSPACVRGAKVRFAGKRARTNARGLTAITTKLGAVRTYPVSVSKRGCKTARGTVVATR